MKKKNIIAMKKNSSQRQKRLKTRYEKLKLAVACGTANINELDRIGHMLANAWLSGVRLKVNASHF